MILTIYLITALKNDHFMIDIECLAACGSKVAIFNHPDFLNFEFLHFRWPFSGYHIQVMNRENDPKWPIFGQKWPKLAKIGPKMAIF